VPGSPHKRESLELGDLLSKFFIIKEAVFQDTAWITGADVAHIKRVLRKKAGDELILCDEDGTDYQVVIKEIGDDKIETKILMIAESDSEPKVQITLYQCLPKQDKLEYIIMKATELGVHKIVPVASRYAVAKVNDKAAQKLIRWNKIAKEAAKQCMRSKVPEVLAPISFEQAASQAIEYDLKLIPYELERATRIKPLLNGDDGCKNIQKIAVYIGPEGGFDLSEVELALKNGIIPVTLGKRILRTETAGCAVLSMLLYALDEV
jgi:16S rRNA (uracil1498-N3)-methyltransferase